MCSFGKRVTVIVGHWFGRVESSPWIFSSSPPILQFVDRLLEYVENYSFRSSRNIKCRKDRSSFWKKFRLMFTKRQLADTRQQRESFLSFWTSIGEGATSNHECDQNLLDEGCAHHMQHCHLLPTTPCHDEGFREALSPTLEVMYPLLQATHCGSKWSNLHRSA